MTASIEFYANIQGSNAGELINNGAGSGLGFYGNAFGVSVPVGSQQTTTFVTNATGTDEGSQLNNTAQADSTPGQNPGRVSVNTNAAVDVSKLPNYLCPLNIRFTNDDAVRVQNCKVRVFDRNNIDNNASGVATYVYEARHPSTDQNVTQLAYRGRTGNEWVEFEEGLPMSDMVFTPSPGISGTNSLGETDPNVGYLTNDGSSHESQRHDWYCALSSEPTTIGSKTQYALYFSCEYLS